MNLLVDAHVFDETHQGSRTYLKGLYRELVKLLPETSFFFAAYNFESIQGEIGDYPNVHFVQLKRGKYLRLLIELPYLIRKYKIDYAHFQYISPPIKNCKTIVTVHDILFRDFKNLFPLKYRIINNFLFRISAKRANILLTVSEYSRRRISAHYKIPLTQIGITPNGISPMLFGTLPLQEPDVRETYQLDKYILYVSRIEPRKNHLLLLQAFLELKLWEDNYKLVCIGKKDFSYSEIDSFLASCSEECKINILLLQDISDASLRSFYKNANLFVYPSIAEGFGIPPIEAISAGTPTLCSNTTAMSDFTFLENDLFNPYDIDELKTKILKKLSQPTDLNRTALLKQIVAEKYSWNKSAENFAALLRQHSKQKG
jgi:glycosyltransferase involved in cell wall biosynthesis